MDSDGQTLETRLDLWSREIDRLALERSMRGVRPAFQIDMYIDELKADLAIARMKLAASNEATGPERLRLERELAGVMNSIEDALKTGPTWPSDGGNDPSGSD